jgi:hypothetical protein
MARPWLQRSGDPDFCFVRPDHPHVSGKYRDVEPFPELRVLTSFIHLPSDQTILVLNGARKGAYTR